jgi:hypothetical protein
MLLGLKTGLGLDDCCGLNGLNLFKILKIPEKKFCPWAKEAKETTTKQIDHSLITSTRYTAEKRWRSTGYAENHQLLIKVTT